MSFDRRIKNDINVRISQGAIILWSVLTRAEYPSTRMCKCVLVLVTVWVIRESLFFFFGNKGKMKYVGQTSSNVSQVCDGEVQYETAICTEHCESVTDGKVINFPTKRPSKCLLCFQIHVRNFTRLYSHTIDSAQKLIRTCDPKETA